MGVEEYLRTSYRPDCDYIDGIVEERNLGELDHGDFQGKLVSWIWVHLRGFNAIPELRVQITPSRFRVPDVVILQGKRPAKGVLLIPPYAVVEILSPEDRMNRVQTRMDDYFKLGVRNCWLVDPEARRAWRYTDAGSVELRDLILRGDTPDFVVPLREIFAAMDDMTE